MNKYLIIIAALFVTITPQACATWKDVGLRVLSGFGAVVAFKAMQITQNNWSQTAQHEVKKKAANAIVMGIEGLCGLGCLAYTIRPGIWCDLWHGRIQLPDVLQIDSLFLNNAANIQ